MRALTAHGTLQGPAGRQYACCTLLYITCRRVKHGIATRVVAGVSPSQGRVMPSQGPEGINQQEQEQAAGQQQGRAGRKDGGHRLQDQEQKAFGQQEETVIRGGRQLLGQRGSAAASSAAGSGGGDEELSSERVVSAVMHVEGEDFDRYVLRALAHS